jgi:hypothetical protein
MSDNKYRMAQSVEISLRIPSLRVRKEGTDVAETIANGDVRFSTQLEVETVPKPGTILTLPVGTADPFECEVVRSDWRDDKNRFVVACRYVKRSITHADYQALMHAPGWEVRTLI